MIRMTPAEKIWSVLKDIKHKRLITSESKPIQFDFVDGFFGVGCVNAEDQRKIISKLDEDNIVKIVSPELHYNLENQHTVSLNILPKFYFRYLQYFLMDIFILPKKVLTKKVKYILLAVLGGSILLFYGFTFTGVQLGPFSFGLPDPEPVRIKDDIKIEADLIADSIVITGWEDTGDFVGYLSQITSFYQKHQDIYPVEYSTYSRQLREW